MGNHEMLLIEAVRDIWKNFYEEYADGAKSMIYRIAKSDPKRFISISSRTELYCYNGGESTLLDWAKHGVTMKTINQLASLPVTATYRHYDMCHSGCKINEWKDFLNEEQKVWGLDSLIWNRDHLKEEWRKGRVLLHGHTSTSYAKMYCHTDDWSKIKETSPLVYRNGTKIDLDIASVKTGLLTVFNLDSDSYVVIDKDGNVKEKRKI